MSFNKIMAIIILFGTTAGATCAKSGGVLVGDTGECPIITDGNAERCIQTLPDATLPDAPAQSTTGSGGSGGGSTAEP